MHRLPVESSDIVSIGYDEPNRILEIEFQNNRIYQYLEVEPEIHAQLMRADSYGQFFSTFITRRYRYKKVEDDNIKSDKQAASIPLAFVTGNPDKFDELMSIAESFEFAIEQLDLPVDEIQSEDAEDIALKKAKQAYKLAGRPVVVQDSYWSILALRGFPGAYMSSVTKWFRVEDFMRLMDGKPDRDVMLSETIVYFDGKRPKIFSREYRGTMTTEPRGRGRLTIQEIIVVAGQTKTIAEIKEEGGTVIEPKDTVAYDFAKWFNMHRKIGR
ncbi:MAG: non-canonical purine NTP pyrophosphatase [Candidatus Saccharimonadales bacterium]